MVSIVLNHTVQMLSADTLELSYLWHYYFIRINIINQTVFCDV